MSDVFRDFKENARIARSLMRRERDAASLTIRENATLVAKSRATIDSSRELLRQAGERVGAAPRPLAERRKLLK